MKKFLILSIYLFFCACSPPPEVSETTSNSMDATKNPTQEETEEKMFSLKRGDFTFTIAPKASYEISAQVKSTRTYSRKWYALLSPVDFTLAWGDLTKESVDKHISYSQSNRWYYYNYDGQFPLTKSYIISHSANNHILPATENVRRAALKVKKEDIVRCKGLLVSVSGKNSSNRIVSWHSSLTRSDEGNNSCEVFWVTEIQIGNNVYR